MLFFLNEGKSQTAWHRDKVKNSNNFRAYLRAVESIRCRIDDKYFTQLNFSYVNRKKFKIVA